MVPEDEDMQGLTDLVDESFQRHIQDRTWAGVWDETPISHILQVIENAPIWIIGQQATVFMGV